MQEELRGRVALVTGGSRGIGLATARALARAGANVVISCREREEAAKAAAEGIVAAGGTASAMRFDVGDAAAVKQAIDAIVESHGGLHILVANAGIALDCLLLRLKDDDLEALFRTNVFGAFYCARGAARAMMKARWGRIILLGSVVGEIGNTGQSAYAASKSALEGMARSLARELGSRQITANVVAPGFIETDMTRRLDDDARTLLASQIPLGAIGQPEDVANAVLFLASDRARYITGQVLSVNGGLSM